MCCTASFAQETSDDSLRKLIPGAIKILGLSGTDQVHYLGKTGHGVYHLDSVKQEGVIPPMYELLVHSPAADGYLGYKDGKIVFIYRNGAVSDFVATKSLRTGYIFISEEESQYAYLEIDGKKAFRSGYSTDAWQKEVTGRLSYMGEYSITKEAGDQLIVSNYERKEEWISDEWGEVYELVYHDYFNSGVYSLPKKEWVIKPEYAIIKAANPGYVVAKTNGTKEGSSFVYGYIGSDSKLSIPIEYDQLTPTGKGFIATKDDKTGYIDFNQKELIPFNSKYNLMEYRDGYLVVSGKREWLFDDYGDEYSVQGPGQCWDVTGKEIKMYDQKFYHLLPNGRAVTLAVRDEKEEYSEELYGIVDLKQKRNIAYNMFDDFIEADQDRIWLKRDKKWQLNKMGSGLQPIGSGKFDQVGMAGTPDRWFVDRSENVGVVDLNLKSIVPIEHKAMYKSPRWSHTFPKITNVNGDYFGAFWKNDKFNLYNVTTGKKLLSEAYSEIKIGQDGIVTASKDGMDGVTSIERLAGGKNWIIDTKYKTAPERVDQGWITTTENGKGFYTLEDGHVLKDQYQDISIIEAKNRATWRYVYFFITTSGEGEKVSKAIYDIKGQEVIAGGAADIRKPLYRPFVVVKESESASYLFNLLTKKQVGDKHKNIEYKIEPNFFFRDSDKWGLMNPEGKVLVEPRFNNVMNESLSYNEPHIVAVEENGLQGYYDIEKLKYHIKPEHESLDVHCGGYWKYGDGGKYGLMHENGAVIPVISDCDSISCARTYRLKAIEAYKEGKRYLFKRVSDKFFRILRADSVSFFGKLAHIYADGKGQFYHQTTLQPITTPSFDHIEEKSQYLLIRKGNKYGLLSDTGTVILEPTWEHLIPFDHGHIAYSVSRKWSYLDKAPRYGILNEKGEVVLKPQFESFKFDGYGDPKVMRNGRSYTLDAKTLELFAR